jgi:hypothetical protein
MPTYHVSKVPTSRRHLTLVMKVVLFNVEIDILCFSYIAFKILCVFSTYFIKYAKCVHYKIKCDDNFSRNDFNKLIIKY